MNDLDKISAKYYKYFIIYGANYFEVIGKIETCINTEASGMNMLRKDNYEM